MLWAETLVPIRIMDLYVLAFPDLLSHGNKPFKGH